MKILEKYKYEIGRYRDRGKLNKFLEFNFFSIVSDLYYRENFHSDIIKGLFLIPDFFESFFIELSFIKNQKISFDFHSTIVEREKNGRIDISIIDTVQRKAIIIENKINDAIDMPRQLPRYFDKLTNKGFEVEGILYLSLIGDKCPSKLTWTEMDIQNVERKIMVMSGAYRDNMINLDSIISKSLMNTQNIDHLVFQRQYKDLLNHLGLQKINHLVMNDLYLKIKTQNDLDELLVLKKMLENLPKYRAILIREKFKENFSPFKEVQIWKDNVVYFNKLIIGDFNFAIDVSCYIDKYIVSFFDRNAENNKTALMFIGKVDMGLEAREGSSRLFKVFKYPEEEGALFDFLEKLKNAILKNVSNSELM